MKNDEDLLFIAKIAKTREAELVDIEVFRVHC